MLLIPFRTRKRGHNMKLEWKRIWNQLSVRGVFFLCLAVMMLLFISQQIGQAETDAMESELEVEEMSSDKYQKEYKKKIANIVKEADSMGEISIFSKQNSYADRNRIKTKDDYGSLYNIKITQGDNQLLGALITEKYWTFIMLFFGMFLVCKVPYPEKSAMQTITYSCQKGRKILRKRQLFLVLGFVTVLGTFLYMLNILLGFFFYGGDSSWLRSIQSAQNFWSCTLEISMLEAVLLHFFLGLTGVMAGICTGWALMKKFGNKVGFLLWALLYGMGYLNLSLIGKSSNLNLLHSLNFYQLLFPQNIFTTYQNYNVASYAVGQGVVWMIFVLLTFAGSSLYVVYGKPKEKRSRKKFLKWKRIWKRPLAGIGRMECKEMFWYQKGFFVLAFALLVVYVLSLQKPVSYTVGQRTLNEFYENYGGEITEDTYKELERLNEEYNRLLEETKQLKQKYQKNEITYEEYDAESFFQKKELEQAAVVIELNAKVEKLKKLQEKGYKVELVNERGYNKLFEKGIKRKLEVVVEFLVALLFLAGYFRTFTKRNWRYMVRSTRDGRDIFFLKRMLIFVGFLAAAVAMIYGMDFYNIYRVYPMEHLTAPIRSFELANGVAGNYPIWLYLGIVYLGKIALWCVIGMVCYSVRYFTIIGKAFREETRKDEIGN